MTAQVRALLAELAELRDKDAAVVRDALPILVKRATAVPLEGSSHDELRRRTFQLRQLAGQEASVSTEYLFCLLVSSTGVSDLRSANPYVSEKEADELLDLAVAVILHANRVGQINRCMSEARGLLKLLETAAHESSAALTAGATEQLISALMLKSATLADQLLARRYYVEASSPPSAADGALSSEGMRLQYDPRFLLFEFTHNILLRQTQVHLIQEFVGAVRKGQPLVKQMLMGGGKTTVVGPMLALMLGDGEMLVLQTMPQALLEQSKATLRATFSAIMRKRVFTLVFERSSELGWGTVEKLIEARRNRGVVLCTASTVKSIQLKLLEKMDVLRDTRRKQHPSMEVDLRALLEVITVYRSSCLIMDEVDLLLHPLKSELNFPIGKKHALDVSPQRWQCAIHCCDAVFYAERKSMSVNFEQSARARSILEEVRSRSPWISLMSVCPRFPSDRSRSISLDLVRAAQRCHRAGLRGAHAPALAAPDAAQRGVVQALDDAPDGAVDASVARGQPCERAAVRAHARLHHARLHAAHWPRLGRGRRGGGRRTRGRDERRVERRPVGHERHAQSRGTRPRTQGKWRVLGRGARGGAEQRHYR
jgi:hypothetical protein